MGIGVYESEKRAPQRVRINADVLAAQTQAANAQTDWLQARYRVVLGYLQLRHAAGVLNLDDLGQVSALFAAAG